MGFEPCLSALERPTRAVRSETIAVRSFTNSVKSVWASPPIGWRALPGTRAAGSKDDSSRAAYPSRSAHTRRHAALPLMTSRQHVKGFIHLRPYANSGLTEPIDLTLSSRGCHEIRISLTRLAREIV